MIAQDIIDRVGDQLRDTGNVRWTVPFLLRCIGDAERAIVEMRPAANASQEQLTLVAGVKQAVPADVFLLLDIMRNSTGGKIGRAVTFCDLSMMNMADPNWMIAKAENTVRQWLYEDRDQRAWYCYPPASITPSAPQVDALVSKIPAAPSAASDTLTLLDEYEDCVFAYTLFLCYSLEADYANHGQAQMWLSAFGNAMKGKPLFEMKALPKGADPGAEPDVADKMGGN